MCCHDRQIETIKSDVKPGIKNQRRLYHASTNTEDVVEHGAMQPP